MSSLLSFLWGKCHHVICLETAYQITAGFLWIGGIQFQTSFFQAGFKSFSHVFVISGPFLESWDFIFFLLTCLVDKNIVDFPLRICPMVLYKQQAIIFLVARVDRWVVHIYSYSFGVRWGHAEVFDSYYETDIFHSVYTCWRWAWQETTNTWSLHQYDIPTWGKAELERINEGIAPCSQLFSSARLNLSNST